MLDRNQMEDDSRNEVNMLQNYVDLHRDHSARILNGKYIADLLLNLRRQIIKRSPTSFNLDPKLNNFKD